MNMSWRLPRILITAGPTREYIDPTRFISNPSSGLMGWLLAQEAVKQGCKTRLVLGPVSFQPCGIPVSSVISAEEMFKAVKKYFKNFDILIMSAAVSDYRPSAFDFQKIKKSSSKNKTLKLVQNPDILAWAGKHKGSKFLIGFAAETTKVIENARKKLLNKNLDMIVANHVGNKGAGFDSTKIKFSILEARQKNKSLKTWSKKRLAQHIISLILKKGA